MIFTSEQPKILVVGSSSIDLVLNTEREVLPNETVIAVKSESFFGGKGANQAVGTSRLGASVYFVGCVGMDPHGQQIMRHLVNEGVNVGYVKESEEAETGTAYVTASMGSNTIVVVPAANYCLNRQDIENAERLFETADLILLQLEIPMDIIEYVVDLCEKYNKKIGIYASPARHISSEIIEYAAFIISKSSELSTVFGEESREDILRRYPNKLFVRDDTNATIYFDGSEMKYYRNDQNEIPNKMGMGDAFTSGFSIALQHGNSIADCVKFGNEIAWNVAKHRGSQVGLPFKSDFVQR